MDETVKIAELQQRIKELELQLKKAKEYTGYGLKREDKPETFEEQAQNALPVLKENKDLFINNKSDLDHIIIEGDNYHALSVLNYTHKGMIDMIYIDPPYNTGNNDFLYNDKFLNPEDEYKHSKWLSFMHKRLKLAKKLLSDSGVIFISIDDNEYANLKLLCDSIFGEDMVDTIIWRKSGVGRDGKMKNTTTFRKDHEYIITCFKSIKFLNKINEYPDFVNEYPNLDNDPRGSYKAGSISRKEEASNPNHKNYYTVTAPGGKTFTRQFDISKEDFEALNNDYLVNDKGKKVSRIYRGKEGNSCPSIKIFVNEERAITPYSILLSKGTTTEGTKELSDIMCEDYSSMRPKPTLLIRTLIQIGSNKNSTILDFFAGSGTTGQATLELNQKDGGNRQFILCSNRENTKENPNKNLCKNLTYQRNKKVMIGYINSEGEKIEGLGGGNIRYYITDFIQKRKSTDDLRQSFIYLCNELLCIKENTFNEVKSEFCSNKLKCYQKNNHYTAILYDVREMDKLKQLLGSLEGQISVYLFSLSGDSCEEELQEFSNRITIENIPDDILETYKKIF